MKFCGKYSVMVRCHVLVQNSFNGNNICGWDGCWSWRIDWWWEIILGFPFPSKDNFPTRFFVCCGKLCAITWANVCNKQISLFLLQSVWVGEMVHEGNVAWIVWALSCNRRKKSESHFCMWKLSRRKTQHSCKTIFLTQKAADFIQLQFWQDSKCHINNNM